MMELVATLVDVVGAERSCSNPNCTREGLKEVLIGAGVDEVAKPRSLSCKEACNVVAGNCGKASVCRKLNGLAGASCAARAAAPDCIVNNDDGNAF